MNEILKFAPFVGIGVVLIGLMYFVQIRPEKKRRAEQTIFISKLKKGDKVVTIGGMYGVVYSISDTTVILTVETGAKVKFEKIAIAKYQS